MCADTQTVKQISIYSSGSSTSFVFWSVLFLFSLCVFCLVCVCVCVGGGGGGRLTLHTRTHTTVVTCRQLHHSQGTFYFVKFVGGSIFFPPYVCVFQIPKTVAE